MIKQVLVDMLIRKIKKGEINPKTDEAFKVSDIKIQAYKDAVEVALN